MTKNDQTFEMKMTRLETIVKSLDEEEVSLEKSLELYQEGIKLSQECDNILKNAELKVEELNKDTDNDGE
ncbi:MULTISPECIES: exodeoxyribonuclease VII small subunit [Jeotgalicoccus]|jgi:exodeoxyribonuclease VII, small subunit|uniref:Exodeoxyribonuclease 7 small subunit n=2 Tax=Jeotgalicoccus TaxID=227979 RepID=A0A3E0B144_9STAP|nr:MULTISPECIES: exodeoxyribonuclease VII small subunit [Jeotgalicoccus]MBF0753327.1 exodeoxyribonuclease VII small subunit [Jeotgalicoccus nanhaiensis]REG25668.1 exodeoxyribonuclease VII small subunit [Jeotgalicoccus halotolerans]TFU62493.1 exodeoxyribonuclease VII small subunit [Jeotgalicoccus nanhaiensis]